MRFWKTARRSLRGRSGLCLTLLLLFIGLFFRTGNLREPVYWVDEVATSMRVAGYTRQQVAQELTNGQWLNLDELQHYQHLNPEQTWTDTLVALQRSPEHTPLYFLLARLWSAGSGSSIAAMRSLSVLFSVIALPCIFGLSRELFGSVQVATVAVVLLSVSPFFVAYAQEARPYSLWAVVLLINSWLLLRAMRRKNKVSWLGYGVTAALSLYTSLLSGLVLLGQTLYVAVLEQGRMTQTMRSFLLALSGAIVAFSPWLWIIIQHWSTLQDNTTWSRSALSIWPMLAIWLYNVAILYFDVPVVASPLWVGLLEVAIALVVTGAIGFSIYFLCTHTPKRCWLFVVSGMAAIPVCLIGVDLVRGNQLSTAARYMLPSLLAMQLAMAYLFANLLNGVAHSTRRQLWRWMFFLLITISLVSCLFQISQPPKYQKSRNLHNQPIATILNQASSPLLLAESRQVLDVISLSYSLKPGIKIQFLPDATAMLPLSPCQDSFVFNPSPALQAELRSQQHWQIQPAYQPQPLIPDEITLSLWSMTSIYSHCSP